MSLEGQQLGEFEILERLGQGGMGEVYKARQISLGRFVALKTLHSLLAGDADYLTRFRHEARAAAVLNHPNLVQVYSAGESEGLHWFAMEYVEGESARMRLDRKGRLDPAEAIAIAIHVATALDYGWRKAALIHSDIKPDNIFLSGDGEVKLGDLGLAKSAEQTKGLTMTGASMGTPHYISPEQAEDRKDIDLRADIYSLGCTLYHLLSGQPPYDGNSAVAVMMKHVSAPVPDLRSVWPKCRAELASVVGKMMQKQPADRQQNYGEAIADLRRAYGVLSGASVPSVVTATPPAVARQKPVAGKRKSAVTVAAWSGGGIALLAAIGVLLYFAPWKNGSAIPGGTRSSVSQTSAGEGGKKVSTERASPSTSATPASSNPIAVATTPQPETAPAPTTPAPIAQLPAPSIPAASTPPPSATPKPATDVEKWFTQVDGPQEEAFQKQALKPFEAGVADLQTHYLASLDAAVAKASAAGQLAEALVWRTERQAFEKARNVAMNDADMPSSMRALRVAFRQQLAKLNEDRTAKAKTLLVPYDAILAKNQILLTQRGRLNDALLLQTKRDEISLAWLGPSLPAPVSAAARPESAKSSPAPREVSLPAEYSWQQGIKSEPPTEGSDRIFLINRGWINGRVTSIDEKSVNFEVYQQPQTFPRTEVSLVQLTDWLTPEKRQDKQEFKVRIVCEGEAETATLLFTGGTIISKVDAEPKFTDGQHTGAKIGRDRTSISFDKGRDHRSITTLATDLTLLVPALDALECEVLCNRANGFAGPLNIRFMNPSDGKEMVSLKRPTKNLWSRVEVPLAKLRGGLQVYKADCVPFDEVIIPIVKTSPPLPAPSSPRDSTQARVILFDYQSEIGRVLDMDGDSLRMQVGLRPPVLIPRWKIAYVELNDWEAPLRDVKKGKATVNDLTLPLTVTFSGSSARCELNIQNGTATIAKLIVPPHFVSGWDRDDIGQVNSERTFGFDKTVLDRSPSQVEATLVLKVGSKPEVEIAVTNAYTNCWGGDLKVNIYETLTKKPVESSGPATQKGLDSTIKIARSRLLTQ